MTESQETNHNQGGIVGLPGTAGSGSGGVISHEPIAIIGLGCRFPKADDPTAFWKLLCEEVDAITEAPADRFDIDAFYDPNPATPGKIVTRYGGFLEQVDKFDPYFFGISPREAANMDPQHRLMMEVAWEAIEDAGLIPEKLSGLSAGVIIGMITNDYEDIQFRDVDGIDIYVETGGARSVASGRLSYMLGLQGPSMTIDTACSSSLVAVHLACRSLQSGECSLALAGGVNLILQPHHSLGFSRANMLAPDGRCKFGDATADGFVRSEGAGVIILKPLSAALADRDRIYALIRGSAVNNDGRSSGFLMTPGQGGQEAVVRAAYRDAGVSPALVKYIEAHGTGTSVGDPIEVKALGAVLAEGRTPDFPCLIGSVKTNIGHTEGAAGIAGIIKIALSLKHGLIPSSLHFREPNQSIPWKDLPFIVQQKLTPWPNPEGTSYAGVSSFGISGTNAHVVLEQAPQNLPITNLNRVGGAQALTLSAHSMEALREMAERYCAVFSDGENDETPLSDVCYTVGVRRKHHDHRLAVVAHSRQEMAERLQAFLQGEARPGMSHGEGLPGAGMTSEPVSHRKLVFVFPGQGSQWFGMGRGLLKEEPVFRESLERCDLAIREHVDWRLLEQLNASPEQSRLDQIDVIQPMLFALQVSIANLWRSWGVTPDAVVGASMGEVAAAHIAGVLSLEHAAEIICRRSRLLKQVSGRGAMALVELSIEDAGRLLAGYEDRLSIAVSNSPTSTVLSGEPEALEEIMEQLRRQVVFCRPVKVDVASHSPQMDSLRPRLLEALKGVRARPSIMPFYSTVTGAPSNDLVLDAGYWARNLREPVLFSASTQRLIKDGYGIFIEISPHPILLPAVQQVFRHVGQECLALPSMRQEEDRAAMLGSLGALYASRYEVSWNNQFPDGGNCVSLPSYPWQRERFWVEGRERGHEEPAPRYWNQGYGHNSRRHPLLGHYLNSAIATSTYFWETELSIKVLPYLQDHRVGEAIVLPAASYVEMALAAASKVFGDGVHALTNFVFKQALVLTENTRQKIQLVLSIEKPGEASFRLFGLEQNVKEPHLAWTLHAFGTVCANMRDPGSTEAPQQFSLERIRRECSEAISGAEYYQALQARALRYGPCFRGVEVLWRQPGQAIGQVNLPASLDAERNHYYLHPVLLDSCFQILAAAFGSDECAWEIEEGAYLPIAFDRFQLNELPPSDAKLWGYTRLCAADELGGNITKGDVFLLDEDGRILMETRGLCLRRLEGEEAMAPERHLQDLLYQTRWVRTPALPVASRTTRSKERRGAWLILSDTGGVSANLKSLLEARAEACVSVYPDDNYQRVRPDYYAINPSRPEDFKQLLEDIAGGEYEALQGEVNLWGLDLPPAETAEGSTIEATQLLHCGSALHLIQALAEIADEPPRLWIVTSGSQAIEESGIELAIWQAPLWGLGRVIANEHPEFSCVRVDLSAGKKSEEIEALLNELLSEDIEPEIALRGEARYVARLTRSALPAAADAQPTVANRKIRTVSGERPYRLEMPTPGMPTPGMPMPGMPMPGMFDNLTLRATTRPSPKPGEVEIQVYAAGLNFRDVMYSMGVLPLEFSGGPIPLGLECAGIVTSLGEGVDSLRCGEEVIAVAPWGLSAYAVTPALLVAPKPASLSFEDAAAIPIAFATAHYALRDIGKMRSGEKLLIHSATGGVGLAAIQIARRTGAKVFATAGTDDKRAFLRSLGVEHVYDSRSPTFADEVWRDTDGEGVDLVLNSLAGEAISESLATLSQYGRFLEPGQPDILRCAPLDLMLSKGNISFPTVDLRRLFFERPEYYGDLLREVISQFERGAYEPLPRQLFSIRNAADAFRFFGQEKQIGKIVIALENQDVLIETAHEEQEEEQEGAAGISDNATYLITGGLGGLGLSCAKWLVEQGARHLVLMGRNRPSPTAQEALDALAQAGTQVRVVEGDVSQEAEVARALDEIDRLMPPLKGIIHAAGLLEDGMLQGQNLERFKLVMAPKIDGAWNLHRLTSIASLDFFVLFSSAAALFGSPGQGNYVAANAFLDALAHYRKARGLPALSINWGPWSDVGLATRSDRGGRLALRGLASLSPAESVKIFGSLLRQSDAQMGVMHFDFAQWTQFYPAAARSPFFAEIAEEKGGQTKADGGSEKYRSRLRDEMLAAESGQRRRAILEYYIQEQIAHVLKLSPTRINPHRPIVGTYGLNSLMALEFKNRLEASLNLPFSTTMVWNYPTVAALSSHIATKLEVELDAEEPPVAERSSSAGTDGQAKIVTKGDLDAILSELEKLPDEEARRIMRENL